MSEYKMAPALPKGTRFTYGPGNKKYTAILPSGKKVSFGHRDYEHYKDSVPKSLGGGLWTKKNHLDKQRRANYSLESRTGPSSSLGVLIVLSSSLVPLHSSPPSSSYETLVVRL